MAKLSTHFTLTKWCTLVEWKIFLAKSRSCSQNVNWKKKMNFWFFSNWCLWLFTSLFTDFDFINYILFMISEHLILMPRMQRFRRKIYPGKKLEITCLNIVKHTFRVFLLLRLCYTQTPSGWPKSFKVHFWFLSNIWVTKLEVWLICRRSLYDGVYDTLLYY